MRQLRGQGPSVAEKYSYLYNREELTGIVARGRALEGRARRVYFKLNNNVGDAPALTATRSRSYSGRRRPTARRSSRSGGATAGRGRRPPELSGIAC